MIGQLRILFNVYNVLINIFLHFCQVEMSTVLTELNNIERLKCNICDVLPAEPAFMSCCHKVLCDSCVESTQKVMEKCPFCREPLHTYRQQLANAFIATYPIDMPCGLRIAHREKLRHQDECLTCVRQARDEARQECAQLSATLGGYQERLNKVQYELTFARQQINQEAGVRDRARAREAEASPTSPPAHVIYTPPRALRAMPPLPPLHHRQQAAQRPENEEATRGADSDSDGGENYSPGDQEDQRNIWRGRGNVRVRPADPARNERRAARRVTFD